MLLLSCVPMSSCTRKVGSNLFAINSSLGKFGNDTRRKHVHYNHPSQLGHCNPWQENAYITRFGCQLGVCYCGSWMMGNQNHSVANQNDLFMHFFLPWVAMAKSQ